MISKFPITVLIAARNEEANIGRCLAALSPAQRVIVIDSNSQDETGRISRELGAEIVQFQYHGGYPKKRQWALDTLDIATPWILLIDADEVVLEILWDEIGEAIARSNGAAAYLITKGFHFLGRPFRFGGFSHSAVLLFRKGKARFERIVEEPANAPDMEVHERLLVDGVINRLKTPLIHEDFKGLEAYIDRHNKYSTWEARVRHLFLEKGDWGENAISPVLWGNTQERRRLLKMILVHLPCEPVLWFLYHYIVCLGFLEGRPGLIASQIRAHYIAQVRAKLYELDLSQKRQGGKGS